ncbi:MAG: DUF1109 family protein [Alphaproteobacteria bacterium]|nr:DUF1109 family protein [Alphaproteobacteria bacterium]MBL6938294.1 DUF1109 family protein [Alphaproteobacteria bacterium]MBL7097350.1 DUF1109 family protein [Alphaproteobacteria bacterium]
MPTEDLIARIAASAEPVQRLRPPLPRTLLWFALSLPWVAAVVLIMGVRPDIGERLHDTRWLIEQGAILMTAAMSAMAAFCAGIPGRPRSELLIPLVPLVVWMALLGEGCVRSWLSVGGLTLQADWMCLPAIAMIGFGPAAVAAAMIVRGAPLAPVATTALGALAAGGFAAFGLRLFHLQDASLMVLVWQAGTVFGLVLLAGLGGPFLLRWKRPDQAPR